MTLTKIGYLNSSQNSPQATNFSYIKQYANQSGLTEYNSEVWLPLAIKSFAHDSGHALVRAEYGYPKGSPNTST
jgi:hypothetical protein